MNKNNLFVFSERLSIFTEIQKMLLSMGHFDFSCNFQTKLPEDLSELCQQTQQGKNIVVCKNLLIDALVEKLMQKEDSVTLVFEQAIRLENENRSLLIVPVELEPKKFLAEFLEEKPSFCVDVFGKNLTAIEEDLNDAKVEMPDFDYVITTNSPLSHKIYSSVCLTQKFSDCVLSPIDQGAKIALADAVTYGKVSAKIGSGLAKSFVLSNATDFEALGVESASTKECAFELAKKMLEFADVAVAVIDGIFVAVGNREQIFVSSASLANVDDVCDFTLFKLGRFLGTTKKQESEEE